MRILAALGDPLLQAAIAAALEPAGHEITPALEGFQAMDLFRRKGTDLLLTSFELPGIDGVELARLTRLASRKRIIPTLMFADTAQPELVLKCLQAGVIEFISRSFEPAELRCRLDSLARLMRLQENLLESQTRQNEEMTLVKHMLTKLAGTASLPPGFHMETLHTQRINGDACVHYQSAPGVHFGMLCDATGHGLMAGISTIPVVEAFLSMVARDIPLETIYLEIHSKLKLLLPTDRFVCLLLLRVDTNQKVLEVLNAGMPPVHLLQRSGTLQTFDSQVLPAGIAGVDPGVMVARAGIETGDRILAFSDGLGDLAPVAEIAERYLKEPSTLCHEEHCRVIRALASAASRVDGHRDDLSWALWEVPAPAPPARLDAPVDPAAASATGALVPGFEASFTLDPRFHPPRELLPQVLSIILGYQVSQPQAQLFAMLLTEALTNAVDHGLLGLDSTLKAKGFEAYERHRNLALASLAGGSVRFSITLLHEEGLWPPPIRRIQAEVEDTGPGFDWRAWLQPGSAEDLRPFGRGIALLTALAINLEFNETGNRLRFAMDCL